MVRVLIAGLVAMVIAVAVGPQFIEWLRRQSIGQQIREEGPARHAVKQGTPTMGGLLILVAAFVPALIVSLYTIPGVTILLATLGCGLIGFADDFLKVRKRRSLGLNGRWKMLGLVAITAGVAWATTQIGYMVAATPLAGEALMIFAVVGEELGFVGSSLVIAAFAVFAWAGFRIALHSRDPFGKRLAAGITTLVCGQAAVNLAAVLGMAPLTGIPLPFVSYGGSSLLVLLSAVGVLLNIAVNERVVEARVRDRGRGNRRSRPSGTRGRGSAPREGSDRDVRRHTRPRRVAAGA